jgi:hypothetical protein
LAKALTEHIETVKQLGFQPGHLHSPELFEFARKYCLLHAAAACVEMWVWNRGSLGEFFSRGNWLVLALQKILRDLGRDQNCAVTMENYELVTEEMVKQFRENQLFSIAAVNLA